MGMIIVKDLLWTHRLGVKGNPCQNGLYFKIILQGGEKFRQEQIVGMQVVQKMFLPAMFGLEGGDGGLKGFSWDDNSTGRIRAEDLLMQGYLVVGLLIGLGILFGCEFDNLFLKDLKGELHEMKGQGRFDLFGNSRLHNGLSLLIMDARG